MYENGGPIVMVQVENEYAGYGNLVDPDYLPWLRDLASCKSVSHVSPLPTMGFKCNENFVFV